MSICAAESHVPFAWSLFTYSRTFAYVSSARFTVLPVHEVFPVHSPRYPIGPSAPRNTSSNRWAASHLFWSPSASGVIPLTLSAAATVKNSSQVVGAASLLSSKIFLLYQRTFPRCTLTGTEY